MLPDLHHFIPKEVEQEVELCRADCDSPVMHYLDDVQAPVGENKSVSCGEVFRVDGHGATPLLWRDTEVRRLRPQV